MFEFFPDNRGWSFTCLRLQAESYNVVEYVYSHAIWLELTGVS